MKDELFVKVLWGSQDNVYIRFQNGTVIGFRKGSQVANRWLPEHQPKAMKGDFKTHGIDVVIHPTIEA